MNNEEFKVGMRVKTVTSGYLDNREVPYGSLGTIVSAVKGDSTRFIIGFDFAPIDLKQVHVRFLEMANETQDEIAISYEVSEQKTKGAKKVGDYWITSKDEKANG